GTTTPSTNTSGVATFDNLSINLVGSKQLRATSGTPFVTSTAFNITPAAANKLVFVQQPTNTVAGVSISPAVTVQLQDSFSNNVSSSGVSVAMALSTGNGTLSPTTTQSTNGSGLATFNDLSINLTGSKNLTASSGGLASAVSNAFSITASAVGTLTFAQQPTATVAGVSISPAVTVQAKDAFGNNVPSASVTMTLTGGATGTLSGTTTQPTDANGIATFGNLSINLVGSKSLKATSGSRSVTSTAFLITQEAGTALAFVQQPTQTTAGASITPAVTVQLQDSFGNNASSSGVSVTMALPSGSTATL